MELTSKQKEEIINKISSTTGIKVSYSPKYRQFIAKYYYFYRPAKTEEDIAEKIKTIIPKAQIMLVKDFFNPWPKNSWYEVRFIV